MNVVAECGNGIDGVHYVAGEISRVRQIGSNRRDENDGLAEQTVQFGTFFQE